MSQFSQQPPTAHTNPADDEEYKSGLGFERIIFFSDAVFAIAITLLVLELRVPEGIKDADLPETVGNLAGHFLSYFIGFMVLGIYWFNHHHMFGSIKRYDQGLLWLNLLFLMVVAFLPFPTSLLGEYGNTPFAVVFYASSVIAAALLSWFLWLYATRNHRLVNPVLSKAYIRQYSIRSVMTAIVFLISIPIALFVDPSIAMYSWLLLMFGRPIGRLFMRFT